MLRLLSGHLQQRPAQLILVAQRAFAGVAEKPKATAPTSPKTSASTGSVQPEVSDEPIQFFGSQAATWRAKDTRSGGADDTLSYQPYVISASLAIFLLYFCVFREESDIDQKLEGNLFDHVSGLEEIQLTVNYKYNKENGLDTAELERRLTELGIDVKQLEKQRVAAQ